MSNYQFDDFNIKSVFTNIMWYFLVYQAKFQIFFSNIYDNFLYPLHQYFEKFLNIDEDEDEDDNEHTFVNKQTSFSFISTKLYYFDSSIKKSIDIELTKSDYVVGNKLFTEKWVTDYVSDCNYNINLDTYYIQFIDHNINSVEINSDQYVILDENKYIIKTI